MKKAMSTLTGKTMAELQQELVTLNQKLAQARMAKKVNKLKNVSEVNSLTDLIARVKTMLRQQELSTAIKAEEIEEVTI